MADSLRLSTATIRHERHGPALAPSCGSCWVFLWLVESPLGHPQLQGGTSAISHDPLEITTEDKVGAGMASGCVLVACGPWLFLMMFLVVVLLMSIPFVLFGVEMPEWLFGPIAILALVLTIALTWGMSVGMTRRNKEKRLIRDAELKRAKRELED